MLVVAVHQDRIFGVPDANVFIEDVMHQAAFMGIRFDPDAVVRTIDREISDQNVARAAVGFAANRHPVSGVEVIMRDGHLGGRTGRTRFDCYLSSPV